MECNRHNFCHSGLFLPFYNSTDRENQKYFEKMKKAPGDIILYICTITDNHVMYGSWDMEHDRKNFGHLGTFLPFYPPNNLKNQNFEKMKKLAGDIILHRCNINDNHMMYGSWDTKRDRHNFLSFWTSFCPFTP